MSANTYVFTLQTGKKQFNIKMSTVDHIERVRAEYEEQIAILKKQLNNSKAKALSIVQSQQKEAQRRISSLEDDARLRADELSQLKGMLRLSEDEKSVLSEQAELMRNEIDNLKKELSAHAREKQETISHLADIRDKYENFRRDVSEEKKQLQCELDDTRSQLETTRKSLEIHSTERAPADDSIPNSEDVESSADQTKVLRLSSKLPNVKNQCNDLSLRLKEALDKQSEQAKINEKAVQELTGEKDHLEKCLEQAKARITQLEDKLSESEESAENSNRQISPTEKESKDDEEKKVLEAKVAEMERLVASKQAEVSKVRDKARIYLKELNAERCAMEQKSKDEINALKQKLEQEQVRVVEAEHKTDNASKEIDNCLAVIREKQKTVQMLKMSITTHKDAADEAKRELESLKTDFARYKERARLALQEKETSAVSDKNNTDMDSASLLSDLEAARKEIHDLRKRLQRLQSIETQNEDLKRRIEQAEMVAELLRKDSATIAASTNYSQVDRLEENIAQLESQLSSAQAAANDSEARYSTLKLRLEGAERTLQNAELRAKDYERSAHAKAEALRARIDDLEIALKRAQEAADSAQRTAAAAAKALAFTTDAEEIKEVKNTDKLIERSEDYWDYDVDANPNGSRSILATVLEDHSDRLGLSPKSNPEQSENEGEHRQGENNEVLLAKEQQIALLSSQLAEVGALFDEVQNEAQLRAEQIDVLKKEVKNLDAKLAAAEKLSNGAPFSYLRMIVTRYLETEDATLLPVICNVLSLSDEETSRIKTVRGTKSTGSTSNSSKTGYFSLPFIGLR